MKYPRYPQARALFFSLRSLCLLALLTVLSCVYFGVTPAASNPEPDAVPGIQEYPAGPLSDAMTFDKLLVEKEKRLLTAYHQGKAVRVYHIALGAAPVGHKQFQGDRKTPEGTYTITNKNPHSAYHKNLGISYPNAADRNFARRAGKSPGGDIKIHGLAPAFAHIGTLHREYDWTEGCIAVTNDEIDELYARTIIGASIHIAP